MFNSYFFQARFWKALYFKVTLSDAEVEGGPADDADRIIVVPALLRVMTVPLESRTIEVL